MICLGIIYPSHLKIPRTIPEMEKLYLDVKEILSDTSSNEIALEEIATKFNVNKDINNSLYYARHYHFIRAFVQDVINSEKINGKIVEDVIKIESISNRELKNEVDYSLYPDSESIISKYLICPLCNHKNSILSEVCTACASKFLKCSICKKPISRDDIVYCPFCSLPVHKIEFLEWLKVNANSPHCKSELDMWEFQKFLEENSEELPQIRCSSCKKLIPADSNYCIFCRNKI